MLQTVMFFQIMTSWLLPKIFFWYLKIECLRNSSRFFGIDLTFSSFLICVFSHVLIQITDQQTAELLIKLDHFMKWLLGDKIKPYLSKRYISQWFDPLLRLKKELINLIKKIRSCCCRDGSIGLPFESSRFPERKQGDLFR